MEIKSKQQLRKPANKKPSEFAIRHTRFLPERKSLKMKKCKESSHRRTDSFQVATVLKANHGFSHPSVFLCHSQKCQSKNKTNKKKKQKQKTKPNRQKTKKPKTNKPKKSPQII